MYNTGNNYQRNPLQDLKAYFRNNNILVKLILINVAVWVTIMILDVMFDLFKVPYIDNIIEWLAVPASIGKLITRPWTVFTYMFLHYDLWHILFNMLWLYWFGRIFLQYLSDKQLLWTYILGGLAGALVYILSFNIFPKFQDVYISSMALGASASVMAIVVGISFYVPNFKINLIFIGPVKIVWVAVFSIVLDIFMVKSANSGGHLAHIGGAAWGYLFAYYLRHGKDITASLSDISFSSMFKRKPKSGFKGVYSNDKPMKDEDYNYEKKQQQKKIDHILDKISKSGYESLTKEEKELLFSASNKKK
jgi:membrane associated rhomboid family serine protease